MAARSIDQLHSDPGDQAAEKLTQDLPRAVDAATPHGSIPGLDEVKQAFSKLFG